MICEVSYLKKQKKEKKGERKSEMDMTMKLKKREEKSDTFKMRNLIQENAEQGIK